MDTQEAMLQVHENLPESSQLEPEMNPSGLWIPPATHAASQLARLREAKEALSKSLIEGKHYLLWSRENGHSAKRLTLAGAQVAADWFDLQVCEPTLLDAEVDPDRIVTFTGYGDNPDEQWRGYCRYSMQMVVLSRLSQSVVGFGLASATSTEKRYRKNAQDSDNTVYQTAYIRCYIKAVMNAARLHDLFDEDIEEGKVIGAKQKKPSANSGGSSVLLPPAYFDLIQMPSKDRSAFFAWCKEINRRAPDVVAEAQGKGLKTLADFDAFCTTLGAME